MNKLVIGLCKGRHEIPNVTDYIFENEINPTDLNGIAITCYNKLSKLEFNSIDLYVTGLTVALITVVNYCSLNHIPLTLYHFDRDTDGYYPQCCKTQVDNDLLIEGGYLRKEHINLDKKCM